MDADPGGEIRERARSDGRPRILSTAYWPKRAAWMSRVDALARDALPAWSVLRQLATSPGRYDAVVIDGATGGVVRLTDLGAAALLARRRTGPAVVVLDATWGRGRNGLDRLCCRLALRAIDGDRVTYCVLSREETRLFPATWGVPAARVAFTPFYFTAGDEDLAAPTSEDGGVFSGGDSLRDYAPLLEAARGLDAPVTLATGALAPGAALPPNVRAGRVPHAEFMRQMRRATAVVVALARTRERSAGQQTYLNAMAMGKVVIVPDVLGVRDYVEDGRTGIVVPPGDAAALARALRWVLDSRNAAAVRELGGRAREDARARFSPERYVASVLEVVERAAGRRSGARRARLAPGAAG